jgi:Holliday junction resolvasome RuvABC endonuclease subunit
MIALGIDCATCSGWARIERIGGRERMLDHGVLKLADPAEAWRAIAGLAAHTPSPDVVAVELPYVDKNIDTAIKLALLAGQFKQAFGSTGAVVELVRASQWQAAILGRFGGGKRADRKKAAKIWARAVFDLQLSEDEADAAAVATWAARRAAFAQLKARAA